MLNTDGDDKQDRTLKSSSNYDNSHECLIVICILISSGIKRHTRSVLGSFRVF